MKFWSDEQAPDEDDVPFAKKRTRPQEYIWPVLIFHDSSCARCGDALRSLAMSDRTIQLDHATKRFVGGSSVAQEHRCTK